MYWCVLCKINPFACIRFLKSASYPSRLISLVLCVSTDPYLTKLPYCHWFELWHATQAEDLLKSDYSSQLTQFSFSFIVLYFFPDFLLLSDSYPFPLHLHGHLGNISVWKALWSLFNTICSQVWLGIKSTCVCHSRVKWEQILKRCPLLDPESCGLSKE